jgi:hypothetical protein
MRVEDCGKWSWWNEGGESPGDGGEQVGRLGGSPKAPHLQPYCRILSLLDEQQRK